MDPRIEADRPRAGTSYKVTLRDRFVGAACNFFINRVATKEYQAFLSVCYDLGQGRLERKLLGTDDPWQDVGPRKNS